MSTVGHLSGPPPDSKSLPPTQTTPPMSQPHTNLNVDALLANPITFVKSNDSFLPSTSPSIFNNLLKSYHPIAKRQQPLLQTLQSVSTSDSLRTSSSTPDIDSCSSADLSTAPTSPPTSTAHSENGSVDKEDEAQISENIPSIKKRKRDEEEIPKRVAPGTRELVDSQLLENEPIEKAAGHQLEPSPVEFKTVEHIHEKSGTGPEEPVNSQASTLVSPCKKRKADDTDLEGLLPPSVKYKKDAKDTIDATVASHSKVRAVLGGPATEDGNQPSLRVKGIRNPHVMCYRNSVLQFLASCNIFVEELAKHKKVCRVRGSCVSCGLAGFFKDHFRGADKQNTINPSIKQINSTKRALPEPFDRPVGQEDAYEYLTALLNTAESQLTKGLSEKEKKSHPIYYAFNGCFPSVVRCSRCEHESSNNMDSTSLLLEPLAPRSKDETIPLEKKLREYFASEKVEWKCEKCKSNQGFKMNTMSSGPEFLIINIARHKPLKFAWRRGTKVTNKVEFPETLQMPVTRGGKGGQQRYQLRAVVAHAGNSMTSGHYISYVHQPDGTWARCNDEEVTQIAWKKVASCDAGRLQACLLGYRKVI